MGTRLFEKGREGFLDGTCDWDTNTFKVALLDLDTAETGVRPVTGATNATPVVITSASHGFSNGDLITVIGVGGNLSANGVWKAANVSANTLELTDPVTGANVVGFAAYTSGGKLVNHGPSASGDNWDDFDGCVVGTPQAVTSPTVTQGVADAADVTYTSVVGASCEAYAIYKDTGTASTSRMVFFNDGTFVVTCAAQAAAAATALAVERLPAAVANGTVLTFGDGSTATLSSAASAGDRILSVAALAGIITAGARAQVVGAVSGGQLPITPNGGSITIAFPSSGPWGVAPGIFQL